MARRRLALLALWFGFGLVRMNQPMPPAPDLTVLLIQGNVAQGQKWDRALMVSIFQRYLALTRRGGRRGRRTSGGGGLAGNRQPGPVADRYRGPALIAEAADGATALAGSVRFDEADRPAQQSVRPRRRRRDRGDL